MYNFISYYDLRDFCACFAVTPPMSGSERAFRDGATTCSSRHETSDDLRAPAILRRDVILVLRQSARRRAVPGVQQGPTYHHVVSHSYDRRSAGSRRRQLAAGRYLSESRQRSRTFRRLLQVSRLASKSYRTGTIPADWVECWSVRRFKARVHRRWGSVGVWDALHWTTSHAVGADTALTAPVVAVILNNASDYWTNGWTD